MSVMSFFENNNNPVFIPRLMNGKILDWDIHTMYTSIDLSHLKWCPGILEPIRNATEKLIVDPVTHKAFFADSKGKASFKKIGYPDIEPEILYSEKTLRHEFIKISINQQITAGASALIAPYMFSPDTDDTKFSINLTLLSETILYLEEQKIELPLFAKLYVGLPALTRQPVINHIYSRYCDDYSDKIEGIIISIDEFDGKKADTQHLLGYANLVHLIQSKICVICIPIGNFGEVLLALGAKSFGSSINIGESVSAKLLQEGSGGNGNTHNRIYIPEIMGYLNYEEAKLIEYKSAIVGCDIDFSVTNPDSENKSKHYLLSKLEEAESLRGMTREQKINFVIERITKAKNLFKNYINVHGWKSNVQHLDKWIFVLQQAQSWSDPSSDEQELEDLLKELDK